MNRRLIIQGAASFGKSESVLTALRNEVSLGRAGRRAMILTGSIALELIAERHAVTVAEMVQRVHAQDMARYASRLAYRGLP